MLSVLDKDIAQTRLIAVAEEMCLTLQRASRSLYVRETADFACALADLSGRFIAYPQAIGVSGFVGLDVSHAVSVVREREGLEPGDVILTNDPYLSGALSTHLPDVHAIAPYFHDGEIIGYGWTFIHVSDVGGRVPSSVSVLNDSVFAEGLRLPPVKYVSAGRVLPGMAALLRANTRTPDANDGDLAAMLASLDRGRERVAGLVGEHGPAGFAEIGAHARRQTAARARSALSRLADGVYRFADYLDDDAVSDVPLRVAVTATVRAGTVDLDFTGTDPQARSALNVVTLGRAHSWVVTRLFALVGTLDPEIPLNGGLMDGIGFRAPSGTLLNAEAPAAIGVRHATVSRVNDVVSGALIQAAPQTLPAASSGLVVPVVFAPSATGGSTVQVVEPMVGGTGARHGADGIDGRDSGISNLSNNPVEVVESSIAVRVLRYGVRTGSGGAGRWRGGCGLELEFEALENGSLLARGLERQRFRPWGYAGGGPGSATEMVVNEGAPGEIRLSVVDVVPLRPGDRVVLRTAGAGGYGHPFDREPAAVLADVLSGLVGPEQARADYGVEITDDAVDLVATAALRSTRPDRSAWGFGPEREQWDRVFPGEALDRLADSLGDLPAHRRNDRRHQLIREVRDTLPAGFPVAVASQAGLDRARRLFLDVVSRDDPA
ncbi:hydantoinase B/oxoprolinase family protein [Nakamurella flavida]|uniref:Hydantoinase B/oxoprolinase family protein n=1 Tax=Nakamurella flavida TaxID=363630 RepID=A0A938YQ98_9ACTN|nr:hydantoinase B/oxoprolinase family protein [Nakamurella flavida]MBM9477492.1 hydantoinase B/oxoprolinase family protein [Nakamurella flavida]MDP9777425.1 N-methylhydantoinase B [Nakamurella flavida]